MVQRSCYSMVQMPRFLGTTTASSFSFFASPVRIASSNTCFRPFCVSAEHSTYLMAPTSAARRSPSSVENGHLPSARKRDFHSSLSRRSHLVPTRMMGTADAWCLISGHHFDLMFSYDVGLQERRTTQVDSDTSFSRQTKLFRRHAATGSCVANKPHDGKANHEAVCSWVRQRSQAIVVLLASSIPKPQIYGFAFNHHSCRVVVEDRWYMLFWKLI